MRQAVAASPCLHTCGQAVDHGMKWEREREREREQKRL